MQGRNYVVINKLLPVFQGKFKRTNQSYSPSKLANQSILNGAYAIEIWQIYQHFISRLKITKTKWKKNFDHLIKRVKCFNWKKDIHGLWKYMDFAEHRSWSDAPENSRVVCSLTFYQMGMKGKGNVVLVKVD